jgi:hypothetical protein
LELPRTMQQMLRNYIAQSVFIFMVHNLCQLIAHFQVCKSKDLLLELTNAANRLRKRLNGLDDSGQRKNLKLNSVMFRRQIGKPLRFKVTDRYLRISNESIYIIISVFQYLSLTSFDVLTSVPNYGLLHRS